MNINNLFLVLAISTSLLTQAQTKLSKATQHFLHQVLPEGYESEPVEKLPRDIVIAYRLHKKQGVYHAILGVVIDESIYTSDNINSLGAIQNSRIEHLVSIDCPLHQIVNLSHVSGITYVDIGVAAQPNMIKARRDVYADSAKAGLGLPKGLSGKDVVVAIIDYGFDYTHPNFFTQDLQQYRVKRVWDQWTDSLAAPPAGYSYGSEFKTEAEILAAQTDFFLETHGTHVAGIAAGSGGGGTQTGIAHDADLVFIPAGGSYGAFLDALTYASNYASSVGKPLVVNMSMGYAIGPQDGSTFQDMAIDLFVGNGRVYVGSGGNNASRLMHWNHEFTPQDTLKSTISFWIPDSSLWNAFDIWGEANSSFKIAFSLLQPNGQEVFISDFYNTTDTGYVQMSIPFGNDSIVFVLAREDKNPLNNKPNMSLNVLRSAGYHVAIRVSTQQGEIHIWHNYGQGAYINNWGGYFYPNTNGSITPVWPGYKAGNTFNTIGTPGGTSHSSICVGAHHSMEITPTNLIINGQIANFSSRGPTVDGRIKPDITGPGIDVVSSYSSFLPFYTPSPLAAAVQFNNSSYPFDAMSGTSMSAPVVSGIVALMLEANPDLHWDDVRDILRSTARTDNQTGPIPLGGSIIWGWGKVNAWAAINEAFKQISVKSFVRQSPRAIIYPNPTDGSHAQLYLKDYSVGKYNIVIADLSGRLITQKEIIHDGLSNNTMPVNELSNGMYIITISSKGVVNDVLRMSVAR